MTTPAVEERPAVQTEPETPNLAETEAPRGTDGENEGEQTAPGPESESPEGSPRVPDARAQRLTALAEAERKEIREQTRAETVAELTGSTPEAQRDLAKRKLQQAFPLAQQKLDDIYANAKDEYGQPRALTAAEQTAAKNALAAYNLVAATAAEDQVATTVTQVAYSILPKTAQEALDKATVADMPLPDYLNAWVEVAALHTKAVKAMTLEEAAKHSTKLKRELAARDIEQFDAGREQGRTDPAGTNPDGGRERGRSAPSPSSFTELEDKYGRGETTPAETAEYHKLKAAKSKAGN